ncbi:uncharacterized protein [Apostichopus japonicus]|uniref:uncharacterized protein n=1 Tax=Stichopus japonicus TaxID=307972 RepID=UPI003AB593F5
MLFIGKRMAFIVISILCVIVNVQFVTSQGDFLNLSAFPCFTHTCSKFSPQCACDELCHYYGDCCFDAPASTPEVFVDFPPKELMQCRRLPGNSNSVLWMVSECPEMVPERISILCLFEPSNDDVTEVNLFRPVSDRYGNVYKNYHCAVCNGIHPSEIELWEITQSCTSCPESLSLDQHHVANISAEHCQLTYQLSLLNQVLRWRSCQGNWIATCPEVRDLLEKEICSNTSSPGWYNGDYYKNEYCARCNGMNNSLSWACDSFLIDESLPDLGVLDRIFDFSNLGEHHTPQIPQIPSCNENGTYNDFIFITVNDSFISYCDNLLDRAQKCFFDEIIEGFSDDLSWDSINDFRTASLNEEGAHKRLSRGFRIPRVNTSWLDDLYNEFYKEISIKSCYLSNVELIRICGYEEWSETNNCSRETIEYKLEDNSTTDEVLSELASTFGVEFKISWFRIHTKTVPLATALSERSITVCLTDVKDDQVPVFISSPYYLWLHTIFGGICCIVAVFSHIATFLTYLIFSKLRNTFGISLMSFVFSVAMGIVFVQYVNDFVITVNDRLCQSFAVIGHFCWLSSFSWLTILVWDLYATLASTTLRIRKASSNRRLALYCCLGWVLPFLIIAACLTMWLCELTNISISYGSVQGKTCWINPPLVSLFVVGVPLTVSFLANMVLFSLIGRSFYHHRSNSAVLRKGSNSSTTSRKGKQVELIVYIKMAMLMGFSWFFGFLSEFSGVEVLWAFYYLSFLLQGLVVFIFFGLGGRAGVLWRSKLGLSGSSSTQTQMSTNVSH